MPSTYSSNLRLELMANTENNNTWGTKTNNNLSLIEDAISGYQIVSVGNGGLTSLTFLQGSADTSRQAILECVGALTSAAIVEAPAVEAKWIVRNSTTGNFSLTFRVSGSGGMVIPQGKSTNLFSNATSVYPSNDVPVSVSVVQMVATSASFVSPLGIASGGTSATTAAGALTQLGAAPSTPQFIVLTSVSTVPNSRVLAGGSAVTVTDQTTSAVINLDTAKLSAAASIDVSNDKIIIYNTSAGEHRSVDVSAVRGGSSSSGTTVSMQVFTTAGTWTKPTGVRYIRVICIGSGGGGGGGGDADINQTDGSGGGGGGYSEKIINVQSVSSVAITIGAAGTAGSVGGNGGAGGDTSFGSDCIGKGGSGGLSGGTTSTVAGGAGGVAGTGDFSLPGQQGFPGLNTVGAHDLRGGSSGGGFGHGVFGAVGGLYGAGGSGGARGNGGGSVGRAGAQGIVIVYEFK